MQVKIFTLYDVKAVSFLQPFFLQNSSLAIRALEATLKDEKSAICQNPEDYTLYELGSYDDQNAQIETYDTPKVIQTCVALKAQLLQREQDNG